MPWKLLFFSLFFNLSSGKNLTYKLVSTSYTRFSHEVLSDKILAIREYGNSHKHISTFSSSLYHSRLVSVLWKEAMCATNFYYYFVFTYTLLLRNNIKEWYGYREYTKEQLKRWQAFFGCLLKWYLSKQILVSLLLCVCMSLFSSVTDTQKSSS